jgi:excisionase family DNA binding protein
MKKLIGNIEIIDVEELASILEVSQLTIRTYIRQGKLSAKKIGGKYWISDEALREYFRVQDTIKVNRHSSIGNSQSVI